MGKTKPGYAKGSVIRLPSYTSTSKSRDVAKKFGKQLLKIYIPKNFWGARRIEAISVFKNEQETLFVPWQAFEVVQAIHKSNDGTEEVHLKAIDKYCSIRYLEYPDMSS